jgi:mannose-6-phosphate isomerase-like protein (cupin superfamily)
LNPVTGKSRKTMEQTRYVFNTQDTLHYRFPTHTNNLAMDRSEATTSEAFFVVLEPGEAPPLHVHHDAEQIFYILKGVGTLFIKDDHQKYQVSPGDLVRIPPHTLHRILCDGQETLIYLSIDCFVGGRPLDEPTWESHVRVMCVQNGWDFNAILANKNKDEQKNR